MSFFSKMLGRSDESANVAKQRLQLMLASDRTDIPPETLELLKDEIIAAISKHVTIDRENVEVTVTRTAERSRLVADIPVVKVNLAEGDSRPRRETTRARKSR
jgi:cell division topological specificity factor